MWQRSRLCTCQPGQPQWRTLSSDHNVDDGGQIAEWGRKTARNDGVSMSKTADGLFYSRDKHVSSYQNSVGSLHVNKIKLNVGQNYTVKHEDVLNWKMVCFEKTSKIGADFIGRLDGVAQINGSATRLPRNKKKTVTISVITIKKLQNSLSILNVARFWIMSPKRCFGIGPKRAVVYASK